ncbi:MAG TPA: glycosyltransferase family 2 protein [Candidatus Paceibacterota bacterium]
MEKSAEISVVILCYKSASSIAGFVRKMKELLDARGLSYELVLVANYNAHEKDTDQTPNVVRGLAEHDPHIVVVSKPKEGMMMGWDLNSGLKAATGATIALIDGDDQMPAEDIIRIYDALRSGAYDCAKTYRAGRFDGLKRKVISLTYNALLKVFFPKIHLRDVNSKPKIFTREAYAKLNLKSTDWFADAEMMIQASYLGFRIVEVPTVFHENKHRRSFVRTSAILEFLKNIVVYRFTRMHEFRK